ncbi:hypothetical protein B0H13DRAFT_2655911 [Mycena leptocephala]|nr:hypothetical protein B0H13DRAFT_2655911 [Mycena leptocephala]
MPLQRLVNERDRVRALNAENSEGMKGEDDARRAYLALSLFRMESNVISKTGYAYRPSQHNRVRLPGSSTRARVRVLIRSPKSPPNSLPRLLLLFPSLPFFVGAGTGGDSLSVCLVGADADAEARSVCGRALNCRALKLKLKLQRAPRSGPHRSPALLSSFRFILVLVPMLSAHARARSRTSEYLALAMAGANTFLSVVHARAPRLSERACTLFYSIPVPAMLFALLWALALTIWTSVFGGRWAMGDGRCIFSSHRGWLASFLGRVHARTPCLVYSRSRSREALLCGCGRSSHSVGACVCMCMWTPEMPIPPLHFHSTAQHRY